MRVAIIVAILCCASVGRADELVIESGAIEQNGRPGDMEVGRADELVIESGTVRTLDASVHYFDRLVIASGGTLQVRGDSELIVGEAETDLGARIKILPERNQKARFHLTVANASKLRFLDVIADGRNAHQVFKPGDSARPGTHGRNGRCRIFKGRSARRGEDGAPGRRDPSFSSTRLRRS